MTRCLKNAEDDCSALWVMCKPDKQTDKLQLSLLPI